MICTGETSSVSQNSRTEECMPFRGEPQELTGHETWIWCEPLPEESRLLIPRAVTAPTQDVPATPVQPEQPSVPGSATPSEAQEALDRVVSGRENIPPDQEEAESPRRCYCQPICHSRSEEVISINGWTTRRVTTCGPSGCHQDMFVNGEPVSNLPAEGSINSIPDAPSSEGAEGSLHAENEETLSIEERITSLEQTLTDEDWRVRSQALRNLGSLGIELLEQGDYDEARHIISLLRTTGLVDESWLNRNTTIWALRDLPIIEAAEALEAALDVEDIGSRTEAVRSLGRVGRVFLERNNPDAVRMVITALRGMLNDENSSIRYEASHALRFLE